MNLGGGPPNSRQNGPQHHGGGGNSNWRVGDTCLGKYWEDGQFYPVEITALSRNTAVVLFKEYGNHEEVMLHDLLPLPNQRQSSGRTQQQMIPVTPGLPRAFS